MNKPTPRTDAATYPADCLGQTLVTNRDCPCALERELTAITAERDKLRAIFPQICAAIGNGAFCTPTVSVGFIESIPNEVQLVVAALRARAERAEADAERYRLVTLRQDAELATERGKLDWVFQNCKVEANDYTTGNRDVYYVHDREDLGVAMKEGAK